MRRGWTLSISRFQFRKLRIVKSDASVVGWNHLYMGTRLIVVQLAFIYFSNVILRLVYISLKFMLNVIVIIIYNQNRNCFLSPANLILRNKVKSK